MTVYDWRDKYKPALKEVKRDKGGQPVIRDPRDVTGLCLHQTACRLNGGARRLRLAKKMRIDVVTPWLSPTYEELASLIRAQEKVKAHAVAMRSGHGVLKAPPLVYVQGANGLNATVVNLEIEGNYAGIEDDPSTAPNEALRSTWGGNPDVYTEETMLAAEETAKALVEAAREEGCHLTTLWAHRQSSPMRKADPGQSVWQHMAEWSQDVLKLRVAENSFLRYTGGPGFGLPIPHEWGSKNGTKY